MMGSTSLWPSLIPSKYWQPEGKIRKFKYRNVICRIKQIKVSFIMLFLSFKDVLHSLIFLSAFVISFNIIYLLIHIYISVLSFRLENKIPFHFPGCLPFPGWLCVLASELLGTQTSAYTNVLKTFLFWKFRTLKLMNTTDWTCSF
jgi:hypothetical protein